MLIACAGIFLQPSTFSLQPFQECSMRPHPHLLEIAAWPWLERLSREERRLVTLADVPDRCRDEFARQGFDSVFLMGVWRRSGMGREIARTDPSLRAAYDRALHGW